MDNDYQIPAMPSPAEPILPNQDQGNIFKRHKKSFLFAILGILIFVLASATFPFRNQLFNLLFPKPSSKAFSAISIKVGTKTISSKDLEGEFNRTWGVYAKEELAKKDSPRLTESLIRKEIISQEAQKMGISVSPAEIDAKQVDLIDKAGGEAEYQAILSGNGWSLDDDRKKIEEEILEEKVKDRVVAWRLIDGVSAYLDPLSDTYPEEKQAVINSLTKAANSLSEGADIFQAATSASKDQDVIKQFGLAVSRKIETRWESKIFESIIKLRKGEVSDVLISTSGASFWVVKVVDSNDSDFTKFEDWLDNKRGEYVR